MIKMTKKSTKVVITSVVTFLMTAFFALTGLAIGLSFKPKKENRQAQINPVLWSVDTYDGAKPNSTNWLKGDSFARRGSKTYTINSAESFLKFVEIVNGDAAVEYGYFKDYTIYLNKNINMNGYTIQSIGKKIVDESGNTYSSFQGVFDGSYYTISNAVIEGNGLFGYTENAEIKNVGLYNCTVDSADEYVGAILGEGVNTTIKNSYVRLGSISATGVAGGLVGKLTINRTQNKDLPKAVISNSFVDATVNANSFGGLVGEIVSANNSAENYAVVENCYYGSKNRAYYASNLRVQYNNIVALVLGTDFSTFNVEAYSTEMDSTPEAWTNYQYAKNSTVLNFNYPILAGFVKVFMTGSAYETVVVKDGKAENATSLYTALKTIDGNDNAEVNLIVENVQMNETAYAADSATVKINAAVDTTITRGENSPETLFASIGNSTLVLGDKDATSSTPKLVLDGESKKVKESNVKSGAMVVAEGADFVLGKNVVIQNNVNNTTAYGGGVVVLGAGADNTVEIAGGTIQNCEAMDGAGLAIVNTNAKINELTIKDCVGGGLAVIDTNEVEEIDELRSTIAKAGLNMASSTALATKGWDNITLGEDVKISNCKKTGEYNISGAGAKFISANANAVVNFDGASITNCSTEKGYGAGVYFESLNNNSNAIFNMKSGEILNNTAKHDGAGVYVRGTFIMDGGTISGNKAEMGAGVFRANSSEYDPTYGYGQFIYNGGTIEGNEAESEAYSQVYGATTYTMKYNERILTRGFLDKYPSI